MSTESSFEQLIGGFDPTLQQIAWRLRQLIEKAHPHAVEVVWPRQNIASYGLGPKKMTEHHSYIAPQSKHVNLGFYRGASLADPEGLMEGTGKALRHVKVRSTKEAERPALRRLLEAAVAERRAGLAGSG